MKDLIEKEKAIDVVADEIWHYPNECYKNLNVFENAKDLAEHALRGLPSAQPDIDQWCTDCKEYDKEKHCCPRFNRIIREALKDAEPERKTGKWIQNDNGTYSCSVCQSWIPGEQHYYARYCLYCGADMRGVKQNETD